MHLSYWEQKSWFSNIDFCIIGSGIVGLNCALQLRKKHPKSKILVLEKGILPQGASTKNAGFACFGSVSELAADLKEHSSEEVFDLVQKRHKGLLLLRQNLGDSAIDYKSYGGYEVFLENDKALFEQCQSSYTDINQLLSPIFKSDPFHLQSNKFNFKNSLPQVIFNAFEGQIDTGKMMLALLQKVQREGVLVLNSVQVLDFSSDAKSVKIKLSDFEFTAQNLMIATNAFAGQLLNVEVTPARNQVLITKPIKDLALKGTFHLNEGYYYFRNIHNRLLLGGGRHLNPKGETTSDFGLTSDIQTALENLLHRVILPNQNLEIEQRWSGILGVGSQKKPIVKPVDNRVFCAVRLGGMGVAIGSQIGKDLADLV
ncbi:NAD(P)/FAD-dependent oxidoreductase [Psychroflexus aestuariivivens]|uniref:NAD(P)/FAD-dependent oxidoreductase n=1 Tax=Psychroflexus aestuariivivens TaxID=1795040 RepID=UPI000FDC848E|nr:FAD-dependent oxidoreductase [Psychroflexus aestuariivivens]